MIGIALGVFMFLYFDGTNDILSFFICCVPIVCGVVSMCKKRAERKETEEVQNDK